MKAAKLHRVPLSPAAMTVLDEVRPLMRTPADLVFPSVRRNVALSDMALSAVVRRMNETAYDSLAALARCRGPRGRPTRFPLDFRDWAGETRPEGRKWSKPHWPTLLGTRPRRHMPDPIYWKSVGR